MITIGSGAYWLQQNLPKLIEDEIAAVLLAQGITDFDMGRPYWGFAGAGASSVSLKGELQGWQIIAELSGVEIHYYWKELFKGRVKRLSVENAQFTVTQFGDRDSESAPFSIEDIVSGLYEMSLPLDVVEFLTLDAVITLAGQPYIISGEKIVIDNLQQGLFAKLSVRPGGGTDYSLNAQLQIRPSLAVPWLPSINLSVASGANPIAQATLSIDNNLAIDLSGYFDSPDLIPLIKNWMPESEIPGQDVATKAIFSARIQLPPVVDTSQPAWWRDVGLAGALDTESFVPAIPDFGVADLAVSGAIEFKTEEDKLNITATEPFRASASLKSAHWPELSALKISEDSIPVALNIAAGEKITLSLPEDLALIQSYKLDTGDINIDLNIEPHLRLKGLIPNLKFDGAFAMPFSAVVNGQYLSTPLPEMSIGGSLQLAGLPTTISIACEGELAAPSVALKGDFGALFSREQQQIFSTFHDVNLVTILSKMNDYGMDTSLVNLASGAAELSLKSLRVPSDQAWRHTASIDASNISGLIKGVAVAGMEVSTQLARDSHWYTTDPIAVSVATSSLGVTVEDLRIEVDLLPSQTLEKAQWRLNTVIGKVFSGTFELAAPAEMHFPFSGNTMAFRLSNLDLAEILQLYAQQGISGTGKISGKVPLYIDGDGVSIKQGKLYNMEVGEIRFAASADSRWGNEQLAMTMRLLQDFRYDVLKVAAEFSPSGDLLLQANISGNNPAELDGRQVNFNINVEENLFDLYKALSLTDELTRQLEEKIQGKTGK